MNKEMLEAFEQDGDWEKCSLVDAGDMICDLYADNKELRRALGVARKLAEEQRDILCGLRKESSLTHPFRLPWEVEK